jgi:hypothetical protein
MVLMNDFDCFVDREQAATMSKLVLSLAFIGLVDAEPLLDFLNGSWAQPVEVFKVLNASFLGLISVDCEDLPVKFALIYKAEGAKDLHGRDLPQSYHF